MWIHEGFLGVGKGVVGIIGGGKIDIAVMQPARTQAIASEIQAAAQQGRTVLVLTERSDHLEAIRAALDNRIPNRSYCTDGCRKSRVPS